MAIPWEIIGPVAAGVTVILTVVFAFMLKWKKLERPNSGPPKDVNSVSKKSLCFKQEGRISSNETAIKMIGDQLKIANENNREDHGKIFTKFEELGEKIITEIQKGNKKT